MSKRVYISADYSKDSGDRDVVELLNRWGNDDLHKVDFCDMSKVISGSVSKDPDCRPCDLKKEFNEQINSSFAVIFIIGDKTASRTAGNNCLRNMKGPGCTCTPYKQNTNGSKICKVHSTCSAGKNVGSINSYSYIRHEFEQAKKRNKTIIILYNSLRKELNWLPLYMSEYKNIGEPSWIKNRDGKKIGNYAYIKKALGYD